MLCTIMLGISHIAFHVLPMPAVFPKMQVETPARLMHAKPRLRQPKASMQVRQVVCQVVVLLSKLGQCLVVSNITFSGAVLSYSQ